jgi:hypothetical protein
MAADNWPKESKRASLGPSEKPVPLDRSEEPIRISCVLEEDP